MSRSPTKGSAESSQDAAAATVDDGPSIVLTVEDVPVSVAPQAVAPQTVAPQTVAPQSPGSTPSSTSIEEALGAKPVAAKASTDGSTTSSDASKSDASKSDASNSDATKPEGLAANGAKAPQTQSAPTQSAPTQSSQTKSDDGAAAADAIVKQGADDASEAADDGKTILDPTTIVVAETQPAREVKLRLFGRTDVGQVREHNEDNFIVADLTKASRGLMEIDRTQIVGERGTLLGVCDGMGGAAAGEVASQLAVDIVYERMLAGDPPESRDDLAARLVGTIETAGLRIFAEAKADRTRRGMGTTATIAALMDDHLFLGQVGDSRGYLLRGDRLVQVTRDQSLVNQLIEAGQLTEEEAETFEHNNIILQALGTSESVQVDLTYVDLRRGDTLLLCSDGLSGMVRNDEIREILRAIDDPLEACRELTDRANQAGGHDNVTVVIARFEGASLRAASSEDIAGLKYRKYELPEGTHPSARPDSRSSGFPPRAMTIKSMRPAGLGKTDSDDDHPDDLADAIRRAEDPVDLPREATPSWLATMLIVSAVTCVVVAGYYLLR